MARLLLIEDTGLQRIFGMAFAFYLLSLPTLWLGVWPAFAVKVALWLLCVLALILAGALDREEIVQARRFLMARWRKASDPV